MNEKLNIMFGVGKASPREIQHFGVKGMRWGSMKGGGSSGRSRKGSGGKSLGQRLVGKHQSIRKTLLKPNKKLRAWETSRKGQNQILAASLLVASTVVALGTMSTLRKLNPNR